MVAKAESDRLALLGVLAGDMDRQKAEVHAKVKKLLRCVDARQSCACRAWTPGGAILADFGRSIRAGIQEKKLLAVYKFLDGKGPLSEEHMTSKNAPNFPRFSLLLGGGRRKSNTGEAYIC
jgi:hypothetical protein